MPQKKHLDAISHTVLATARELVGGADVIHYHALGPGLLSGLPRWLARRRTVVTVHGLDWQRDKWGGVARAACVRGASRRTRPGLARVSGLAVGPGAPVSAFLLQ